MRVKIRDYLLWGPAAIGFGLGISRAFDFSILLGMILLVTAGLVLAGMIVTWIEEGA